MENKIEKIGNSTIQHGKSGNRIYLQKLDPADATDILPVLDEIADREGYTKIFTKIRAGQFPVFRQFGYSMEAFIPGFFNGTDDGIIASKFLSEERATPPAKLMNSFYRLLQAGGNKKRKLPATEYTLRPLDESDADAAAAIFKQVFATYPFPVHDPEYIRKTMREKSARYFGVWDDDQLIGISTAEVDEENSYAEMTDFAVLPGYRGKKLALYLLRAMEEDMQRSGIQTLYTIARLAEPGMNKTFMNMDYRYSGTLINNTDIAGSIESMNVFYKQLSHAIRKTL